MYRNQNFKKGRDLIGKQSSRWVHSTTSYSKWLCSRDLKTKINSWRFTINKFNNEAKSSTPKSSKIIRLHKRKLALPDHLRDKLRAVGKQILLITSSERIKRKRHRGEEKHKPRKVSIAKEKRNYCWKADCPNTDSNIEENWMRK